MPRFGGAADLQQNELQNAVIQNLGGAPSGPKIGQIYNDTTTDPSKSYICTSLTPETWTEITNTIGALDYGETGDITPSDFGDAGDAGVLDEVARADHEHPREANPVTAHVIAADPHAGYQKESEKSVAGGYASLDGAGKVPVSELPDTVVGAMDFQGVWNANTNAPDIGAASKTKGDYWIVGTAGATSLSGITDWNVGDFAVWDGAAWQQVDNTDLVASVFGRTGAVTAQVSDYAAFYARSFSATIGDGAATSDDVVHGLGTSNVIVQFRYEGGGKEFVILDWEVDDANTITWRCEPAPANNEIRVVVMGVA